MGILVGIILPHFKQNLWYFSIVTILIAESIYGVFSMINDSDSMLILFSIPLRFVLEYLFLFAVHNASFLNNIE